MVTKVQRGRVGRNKLSCLAQVQFINNIEYVLCPAEDEFNNN